MPIQSNCTNGRIVVAAVNRKRPHRKIDFLSCTFNLCEIILQRSHPHRNCNLAKDRITHSSLSVALAHDQGLPKVFRQTVASPWYCNSTKGHITYSSLSVALADVQGLSKTFGQNTTSPIDLVCCTLHISKIFTRVASPLQLLLGKRSHHPHDSNFTKGRIDITLCISTKGCITNWSLFVALCVEGCYRHMMLL